MLNLYLTDYISIVDIFFLFIICVCTLFAVYKTLFLEPYAIIDEMKNLFDEEIISWFGTGDIFSELIMNVARFWMGDILIGFVINLIFNLLIANILGFMLASPFIIILFIGECYFAI